MGKSHWELFRRDSRRMFLSTLERQPPSNIQFKAAFPPHKSPTRPLLLVLVFGEEYKYSYVLFVQLPFKIGVMAKEAESKRANPVWLQLTSAVSWSSEPRSDPGLKLPRVVGELNSCTLPSGFELTFWLDCFFTPLLGENTEVSVSGNGSQIFKALYYLCKSLVQVLPSTLHLL